MVRTYDVTRWTVCDPAKSLVKDHVVKLGLTSLRLPSEGALAPRGVFQTRWLVFEKFLVSLSFIIKDEARAGSFFKKKKGKEEKRKKREKRRRGKSQKKRKRNRKTHPTQD